MKEIIKTIINDFHKRGIENYKKRNFEIPLNSGKVISLIGSRRAGKTFVLYQLMDLLINKNKILLENIIYINFEDERLNLNKENLNLILEAYLELFPEKNLKNVYFFFDEIQEINGWEKFIRRLDDTISKNIYVTGSSAKLLSREIATSLRGRTLTYEIFPLSFKEYLNFNNIDSDDVHSTANKAKLIANFKKYFKYGGFPELINFEDGLKIKILQDYLNVMIFRDLVERYNIKNVQILKLFIKKGLGNISKEFSANKVYNEFKSMNLKISKDKLYGYVKQIEDIYLLFYLNMYDKSFQKQEINLKKVYSIDNGMVLANSFKFSKDEGRMLENLVFIELKRKGNEVYYHKGKVECDFVLKEDLDINSAIQVTMSLDDENTKKREIGGLVDAMKTYGLKDGLILTYDEEDEFVVDGFKVKVLPVWKWLLV